MFSGELRAALDVLPEPILIVSADATILFANEPLLRQFSVAQTQIEGLALASIFAESPDHIAEFLHRCRGSRQMVLGSFRVHRNGAPPMPYRADGVVYESSSDGARHILIRLTPRPESVSAFVALNQQIGALNAEVLTRKRTEALLMRQRETLEVTLASIGDAVIVTDAEGRVTFMNGVAQQLTGRALSRVLDHPLSEVFPIINEDTGEAVEDPVRRVLSTGRVVALANHTMLVREDGTRVPIDDSAAPIRLPDGTLSGVVLIFRDIGDRRRSEQERLEADRRKDEFLAILAHELRNPLAPIRNAMQIIRVAGTDAASVSASRLIVERQLKHLTRLIDDLMDISRISQGKFEIRRTTTSLNNVAQLAIEIARPQLEIGQHPLHVDLPSEDLTLYADPNRLAQAIANLLHNAAKYSDTGQPITVRAVREAQTVAISVIDAGHGIPADMLERIFEIFMQLERPGDKAREGLGIGLTLVKRIVEMHDGAICAASAGPGQGTQFTLRLPLSPAPEGTGPQQSASVQAPARQQLRILVADDNHDSALTLAMVLRLEGHDVRTAHDGAEALKIGDVFRPQLAILDIGMPVLNGHDTAAAIQARSWGLHCHLVALTGWGQEADRRRAFAAGFHHHLVKPVEPDTLSALIDQILRSD